MNFEHLAFCLAGAVHAKATEELHELGILFEQLERELAVTPAHEDRWTELNNLLEMSREYCLAELGFQD